jgi:hypothetical protein
MLVAVTVVLYCEKKSPEPDELVSSQSYKGHVSDADANNFVNVYKDAVGTRLDDCVLCHGGGSIPGSKGMTPVNACDYCHFIHSKDSSMALTLNASGAASDAVAAIKNADSDGDSYSNDTEIKQFYFPGDSLSNPSKPACPYREVSLAQLKAMAGHTQFMLMNTHKQQYDDYVTFKGLRISALLAELGVDTVGATGITIFAPDGYAKTFALDLVYKNYPKSVYYTGLDDAGLGTGTGFVNYPDSMPYPSLQNGDTIPDLQYMLLAYERDFADLDVSYIDPVEWRIQGDGPFRLVRPQTLASMPDRGSSYTLGDQYDCVDTLDHNAGDMVRGVTIIRVDPMPSEYEEFDKMNAGWKYLEQKKIVVYGHGVTAQSTKMAAR